MDVGRTVQSVRHRTPACEARVLSGAWQRCHLRSVELGSWFFWKALAAEAGGGELPRRAAESGPSR